MNEKNEKFHGYIDNSVKHVMLTKKLAAKISVYLLLILLSMRLVLVKMMNLKTLMSEWLI